MTRRMLALALGAALVLATAAPALADGNNPADGGATSGYEGQPGNQGGGGGGGGPAAGLLGYEGQPGNQGG